MTEHEQRIAIAQWMGWRDFHRDGLATAPNGLWMPTPNFTGDLNAMHEAEARLPRDEHDRYHLALTLECTGYALSEFRHVAISATAAQRAEALLRTLNLWRDDPATPQPTGAPAPQPTGAVDAAPTKGT